MRKKSLIWTQLEMIYKSVIWKCDWNPFFLFFSYFFFFLSFFEIDRFEIKNCKQNIRIQKKKSVEKILFFNLLWETNVGKRIGLIYTFSTHWNYRRQAYEIRCIVKIGNTFSSLKKSFTFPYSALRIAVDDGVCLD